MSKEIDNPVAVLSDYIRGIKGIADDVLDPIEAIHNSGIIPPSRRLSEVICTCTHTTPQPKQIFRTMMCCFGDHARA